jgi:hypothetical protein
MLIRDNLFLLVTVDRCYMQVGISELTSSHALLLRLTPEDDTDVRQFAEFFPAYFGFVPSSKN